MLVAEAFADNDNARSGLVTAAEFFKNVKDAEGHEHGADGKFVSTGGSSGSSKEKPSKMPSSKPAVTGKKRPNRVTTEWYAKKGSGGTVPFYCELKLNAGGHFEDGCYIPPTYYRGSAQINHEAKSASIRVRSMIGGSDETPTDPEHKERLRAVYAKGIVEVLKAAPDTETFKLGEGLTDEFSLEAFHDLIDENGKPNTQFGKKTVACIASTDIAKQQIFKSLPKSIVEPAIAAVTRELGSCSCMPRQLGVLTDSPVIGVSAKSQAHTLAWAMPSKDGHIVRLMSDPAEWRAILKPEIIPDDQDARLVVERLPREKRIDAVMTHEMGHVLEHGIKKMKADALWNEGGKPTASQQKIIDAYEAMNSASDVFKSPSRYGAKNFAEYFAECYAAYRHGVEVPARARALFDLLGSKQLAEFTEDGHYVEKSLKGLWEVYGEPEGTSYDCHILDYADHTPKSLRETAHAFANLRLKKSAEWHEEEHPRDEYGKFTDGFASGDDAELSDPGDASTPEAGSPFAPGGAHAMSGPGGFSTGTAQPMLAPEPEAAAPSDGKIKFAELSMDKDPDALDGATAVAVLAVQGKKDQALNLLRANGGDAIPHLVGTRFTNSKSAHAVAELLNEATDHNFYVKHGAGGKITIESSGPQMKEPDLDLSSAPTFKPVEGWKKIGEQAGSNPGGVYKDKDGNKHYVKFYANENQAKNEALANSFYNVLGIRAPKSSLVEMDGKKAIANTMVDGLMEPDLDTIKSNVNAKKGFVADAFLANHDVVGLTADNMLFNENGHVYRIDNGGALKFRAMGGPKSNLKMDEVPELNSMRNPQYMAGKVFGSLTTEDMKPQAEHLVSTLTDDVIDKLVESAGFDGKDALEYRELLRGRRDAIAKAFDLTPPTLQFNPQVEADKGAEPEAAVPKPAGALSMDDIATAKPYPPTHVAWMAALAKFNDDGTVPANMVKNKNLVAYMIQHKWKDEGQGKLAAAIAAKATGKEVALELGASKKFHHVKVNDKPVEPEPDVFDQVAEMQGNGPTAQADSELTEHEQGLKTLMLGADPSVAAANLLDKYPNILAEIKAEAKAGDAKSKALYDKYNEVHGLSDYEPPVKLDQFNVPPPRDEVAQAQSPDAALNLPTGWEAMSVGDKVEALKEHASSLNEYVPAQAKYMAQAIEAKIPESTPLHDKPPVYEVSSGYHLSRLDEQQIQGWIVNENTDIYKYLKAASGHSPEVKGAVAAQVMKSKIPSLVSARDYADMIADASGKPVKVTVNTDGTFGLAFSQNGVADKVLPTPGSAAMTYPDDLQGSKTAPALSEVATSEPRENEGGEPVVPEYKKPKLALDPNAVPKTAPKAAKPKSPKAKPELKPASPHSYGDIQFEANQAMGGYGIGLPSIPPDIRQTLHPLLVAKKKKWWYGTVPTAEEIATAKQKLFNDPQALARMMAEAQKPYHVKPTVKKAWAKLLSEAFGQPFVLANKGYQTTVVPEHVAEGNGWKILTGKKPVKSAAMAASPTGDTWGPSEPPGAVAPPPVPGSNASYARAVAAKAALPHDIARWAPFVTNEGEQQHVVSQLRAKGFNDAADHLAEHYAAANANPEMNSAAGMQDQIYPGSAKRWGNPALAPARLLHNAFLVEQNLPDGISPRMLYAQTPEERNAALQSNGYGPTNAWLKSFYHHRDLAANGGESETWSHPKWNELYANAKGEEPSDYDFRGQKGSEGSTLATNGELDEAPNYKGAPIAPRDEIVTPEGTFSGTHHRLMSGTAMGHNISSTDVASGAFHRVRQVLPTLLKEHKEKGGPVADPFHALKPGQKPAPESAHAYAMTQRYYEPLLQAARASLPSAKVMRKLAAGRSNIGGSIGQSVAREMYAMMGVPKKDVDRLHENLASWLGSAQSPSAYYLRTAANMLSGLHPAQNTFLSEDSKEKHENIKTIAQGMTPGYLKAMLVHKAITQAVAERFTSDEGTMPMIRGIGSTPAAAVKAHTTKDKNGQAIARLREQSLSGYTTRTGAENPFAGGGRIFRHVKPHEIWHGYRFSPSHGNHESEQEHFIQHVNGGGYVPLKPADAPLGELKGNALLPGKHGKDPTEAYQAMKTHYGYASDY